MKELKGQLVQLRHSPVPEAVLPPPVVQGQEEPVVGAMELAGRKRVPQMTAVERRVGSTDRAKQLVEQGKVASAVGVRLAETKTPPLLLVEQRWVSPAAGAGPTVAEACRLLLAKQGKPKLLVVAGTLPPLPAALLGLKAA